MASEQNGLGPEINRLNFPDSSAEPLTINRQELETLFAPLFDDFFEEPAQSTPNVSAATNDNSASSDKSTPIVQQPVFHDTPSADDQNQQSVPAPAHDDETEFVNPFAPAQPSSDQAGPSTSNSTSSHVHDN